MTNLLDELHTRRGELLDLKYERSRRLLDKNGFYSSDDFKDLDSQIADITEQIELADVKTWLPDDDEAAEVRADVSPEVYDFTPFPKDMPDIKFDTIDPIPF